MFYNLHELEELARRKVSKPAFDFYAGGAEDLASLRSVMLFSWSLLTDLGRRQCAVQKLKEMIDRQGESSGFQPLQAPAQNVGRRITDRCIDHVAW